MLLAVGDLGVTTGLPGFKVLLPILLEVRTSSVVVVLCSFHGPQYVPPIRSLPARWGLFDGYETPIIFLIKTLSSLKVPSSECSIPSGL